MLKYKIDTIEGLDETIAALYQKSGDKYVLSVEGMAKEEDLAGLKSQVETLLAEKKEAAKKAREAEEAAAEARREAAKKSGDTEALEQSYKEKLEKIEGTYKGQIDSLSGAVREMTVDSVAISLANEIAVQGSADILIPHIKARLGAEERDGKYVTVVRDAQGKPSVATIGDLKNEFLNNQAFAPVVVGSKASGGGANGSRNSGGVAKQTITRSQFDGMSHAERQAHFKAGGAIVNE